MTERKYGLIMPFVVVKSKGGDYDDQSYAAGYEAALIDAYLELKKPDYHQVIIQEDNLEQIDLIAMQHGYQIMHGGLASEPQTEDWLNIALVPVTQEDEEHHSGRD